MKNGVQKLEGKISYRVIESACKAEGLEGIPVFGIEAVSDSETARIEDISSLKEKVVRLKSLLERNEVIPNQVIYIVEDFLA